MSAVLQNETKVCFEIILNNSAIKVAFKMLMNIHQTIGIRQAAAKSPLVKLNSRKADMPQSHFN